MCEPVIFQPMQIEMRRKQVSGVGRVIEIPPVCSMARKELQQRVLKFQRNDLLILHRAHAHLLLVYRYHIEGPSSQGNEHTRAGGIGRHSCPPTAVCCVSSASWLRA